MTGDPKPCNEIIEEMSIISNVCTLEKSNIVFLFNSVQYLRHISREQITSEKIFIWKRVEEK